MNSLLTTLVLVIVSGLMPRLASGFLNANTIHHRQVATAHNHRILRGKALLAKNKVRTVPITEADTMFLKELKQRINDVTNPYHELFATPDGTVPERPDHVYAVVFQPDTEQQGFHSIEYPKNSGSNFILAFPSHQACNKFASSLMELQQFGGVLAPQRYSLDSLENMCDELGVFVQVVPKGLEITPPSQKVEQFGRHNRDLKGEKNQLDYLFSMFEMEVDELGLVVEEESEEAWQ